jgi:hypothetical protein
MRGFFHFAPHISSLRITFTLAAKIGRLGQDQIGVSGFRPMSWANWVVEWRHDISFFTSLTETVQKRGWLCRHGGGREVDRVGGLRMGGFGAPGRKREGKRQMEAARMTRRAARDSTGA